MSEIDKLKQDAANAQREALARLNQEETWVQKNPGKVTLIVVTLLGLVIAVLAKSCA